MNEKYNEEVLEKIGYYTQMSDSNSSMLREITWQYANMAAGGDGGELGFWPEDYAKQAVNNFRPISEPTCRSYNYPAHPDKFFQDVCDGMEWKW
jgi:hypothetical protein